MKRQQRQSGIKPILFTLGAILSSGQIAHAADQPAKAAFGAQKKPSEGVAQSIGFYSKGCLAGAQALPLNGAHWQVMRTSRNRNWGNPTLIAFIRQLSDSAAKAGWRGLLVGDLSQPRGGPMTNGHTSHQTGLDADIWLTPMPRQTLSYKQRETMQGISMLKKKSLHADPQKWSTSHTALLQLAALDSRVERIFVHPGIKKHLCDIVSGNRSWLGKIRPYWGHNWHFHVRLSCPGDSPSCRAQPPVPKGDGCDSSLAWWFTDEPWVPKKKKKPAPPQSPRIMMVSDLPRACAALLAAPAAPSSSAYSREKK